MRSKPIRERFFLNRHKTTEHDYIQRGIQPAISDDSSDGKSGLTRCSTSSRDMIARYSSSDTVHSTATGVYGPKELQMSHVDEWGWFVNADNAANLR